MGKIWIPTSSDVSSIYFLSYIKPNTYDKDLDKLLIINHGGILTVADINTGKILRENQISSLSSNQHTGFCLWNNFKTKENNPIILILKKYPTKNKSNYSSSSSAVFTVNFENLQVLNHYDIKENKNMSLRKVVTLNESGSGSGDSIKELLLMF